MTVLVLIKRFAL